MPEILGSANNWPYAFALPGIFSLALCLALPFCPESPKYTLILKGQRDKAINNLNRLVNKKEAGETFEFLLKEAAFTEVFIYSFLNNGLLEEATNYLS